jgi:hypothetical protein
MNTMNRSQRVSFSFMFAYSIVDMTEKNTFLCNTAETETTPTQPTITNATKNNTRSGRSKKNRPAGTANAMSNAFHIPSRTYVTRPTIRNGTETSISITPISTSVYNKSAANPAMQSISDIRKMIMIILSSRLTNVSSEMCASFLMNLSFILSHPYFYADIGLISSEYPEKQRDRLIF